MSYFGPAVGLRDGDDEMQRASIVALGNLAEYTEGLRRI